MPKKIIKEGDLVKIYIEGIETVGIIDSIVGDLITFYSFYTADDEVIDLMHTNAHFEHLSELGLEIFVEKRLAHLRKKEREKKNYLQLNNVTFSKKIEFRYKIIHYKRQIKDIIRKKRIFLSGRSVN